MPATVNSTDPSIGERPAYYAQSLRQKYILGTTSTVISKPLGSSADIGLIPNYDKFQARAKERLALGNLESSVPKGWPLHLDTPMTWTGEQWSTDQQYVLHFSENDILEINDALHYFQGLDLELQDVNRETFRLPTLGIRLQQERNEVHFGKGFVVLRGLNPKKYSGEENTILFLGISSYFGETRGRQDQAGNMLKHILEVSPPDVRSRARQSIYTTDAQPFHSDLVCDILALQTLSCAALGGKSIIASSWAIYNELASTRPDLIHTLSQRSWTFDTFGRDPPFHQRPLLYFHAGRLILNFSRRNLTGSRFSPRSKHIPPMTEAQAEALDAVHFIARKHQLSMDMQPGDLRFINNLSILHCRDTWVDDDSTKRHLVRLWLRNDELAWGLPDTLGPAWDRVFMEGVDMPRVWDNEPIVTRECLLNPQGSCGQG